MPGMPCWFVILVNTLQQSEGYFLGKCTTFTANKSPCISQGMKKHSLLIVLLKCLKISSIIFIFFFQNHALRADLWDFADMHNSASPGCGLWLMFQQTGWNSSSKSLNHIQGKNYEIIYIIHHNSPAQVICYWLVFIGKPHNKLDFFYLMVWHESCYAG